uniref:EF-hand domain-containing protein n=1 Tax=Neogobius melanostomus TaxID=47308 RepID=A0A8C6TZZ6_9GOBI
MARLENIITSIHDIFMEYADDGGNKKQLNPEELKNLLEKEIQSPELKDKISVDAINEAMEMIDKNRDGEVNFREFCRCVCVLLNATTNLRWAKEAREARTERKMKKTDDNGVISQ